MRPLLSIFYTLKENPEVLKNRIFEDYNDREDKKKTIKIIWSERLYLTINYFYMQGLFYDDISIKN